MKKLAGVLIFALILYIIYYDVAKGTLPVATEAANVQIEPKKTSEHIRYQLVKVKAGDTLLSVAMRKRSGALPVPISRLIQDFETLNPGAKANALQIGKTYKIPTYK